MVKQGTVLVVDDNKGILKALGLLLDKYFDKVILISSPNRIAGTLWNERVDVVLLDMNFSAGINTGNEGIYWLSQIKRRMPTSKSSCLRLTPISTWLSVQSRKALPILS